MAGDIQHASQICRKYCNETCFCVTIVPAEYAYKGGHEAGFIVGIRNYPRFVCDEQYLTDKAKELAQFLRRELCQDSSMIVTPKETTWITNRSMDYKGKIEE